MAGYILKITIENTHPPVWRRIIIPEKITFADLHEMIQLIFGWKDEHLHDFRIPSKYICIDNSQQSRDRYHYMEEETPVESFLLNNKWVRYTYDFGDEWRHKIVYEKTDETYEERYATLLKFKGDNFFEDSGGVWEAEEECRSVFDSIIVEERLKRLVCPVCDCSVEIGKEEANVESLLQQIAEQLGQSMRENLKKYAAKTSVSQMKNKIDAWKEFVENWQEKTEAKTSGGGEYQQMTLPFVKEEDIAESSGDTWEIVVPGCKNEKQQGKSNRELLQSLSYKEAQDYCKYLQIPVLDTWTKKQMIDAIADLFEKYPEYFLYVFFEDEYEEFFKLMKLSCRTSKEKPESPDILIKGAALGLIDISITHGKNGNRAKISFASDAEALFLSMNAKERKIVYRKLNSFSDNLRNLILFYGIMELETLYKIYCQIYRVSIERAEFNRYVYWYGRFNNLILTATTKDGVSYVASPELDLDAVNQKLEQYSGDLEYIVYPAKKLKKIADNLSERSEWLDVLFTCLHFKIGLPKTVSGKMVEELFCGIMNGELLPEIMGKLYEMLDTLGVKVNLVSKCEIWEVVSGLMLELELPMLKGRSRNRYGEEKKISPWKVGMCDEAGAKMKSNSGTRKMQEFPVEIQEMMYEACIFADDSAMKRLMQYREKENVQSEEFLVLLASAQITGCEFEQASEILKKLERGSKQARKASSVLRMRLEQGEDVMEEPWEPIEESWNFMESPQKPYVREERKIGRNEPCPCGSGKKYKHCCGKRV